MDMRRRGALVASALVVAAVVATAPAPAAWGPVTWEPSDVRVSDPAALFPGPQQSLFEPSIAIDPTDPRTMLAFALDFSIQNHNPDGYTALRGFRSTDGGATWLDTGVVDYDAEDPEIRDGGDPVVAFGPGGEAYLASLGYGAEGNRGVFVHRSLDGGASWELPALAVPRNHDPVTGTCGGPDKEWLTVDQRTGTLYLTYSEFRERCPAAEPVFGLDTLVPTDIGVYLTTSQDGISWSEPARLWKGWALGSIPEVAPDGTIHVSFWSSVPVSDEACPSALGVIAAQQLFSAVVVATSPDGGATWTTHEQGVCTFPELADALKPGRFVGGNFAPSIAVDPDGTVSVAYPTFAQTQGRYTIEMIRSTDAGATWSSPVDVTPGAHHTTMPTLAADPGALRLTYVEVRRDGTADTFYLESTDGAATWSAPVRLSTVSGRLGNYTDIGPYRDPHLGDYMSLDVAGGRIAAIWTDARRENPAEIWMRAGTLG